jgi:hypothetical protein
MNHLKSTLFQGIAICMMLLISSCQHDESFNTEVSRGKLLSFTLLQEYSIAEADSIIDAYDDFLSGYPVDYPINIYRVTYTTINTFGEETIASGAVVVPMDTVTAFPLCSYQHGTITEKYEVPSYEGGEL